MGTFQIAWNMILVSNLKDLARKTILAVEVKNKI